MRPSLCTKTSSQSLQFSHMLQTLCTTQKAAGDADVTTTTFQAAGEGSRTKSLPPTQPASSWMPTRRSREISLHS